MESSENTSTRAHRTASNEKIDLLEPVFHFFIG